MEVVPCPLCGYDAPGPACPHCGGRPSERSLTRALGGPLSGVWDGLTALPRGLLHLARTRGVKRWLLPPLLLTCLVFVLVLWWTVSALNHLVDELIPGRITLDHGWAWLDGLSARWDWLKATWSGIVAAAEWTLNGALFLLASHPLRLVGWFLLGSLAAWYSFSIAYEALAGPFLDEIQARMETRWFGSDPRNRIHRPTDIPAERCVRLSLLAAAVATALLVLLAFTPWFTWWALPVVLALGLVPSVLVDPRYARWLRWVAEVEGGATWASLQAAAITGVLLVLALPLYFVPVVGYFLFAMVAGFGTAVGLLDIPFERRGWSLRMRMRFFWRELLPLMAFGMVSGALLSIPILGPLLMVPSASTGGLWLVCRLDKRFLRPAGTPGDREGSRGRGSASGEDIARRAAPPAGGERSIPSERPSPRPGPRA